MTRKKQETFADMIRELQARPVVPKPVGVKDEQRYFLIVCEGSRTEPNYFEYIQQLLPKHLVTTLAIEGGAGNTVDVVNLADQKRKDRAKSTTAPLYDEVWAVFDKDDFPVARYNQAIKRAGQIGIYTAESNESFELWYVLHFQYLDTAIHRADYIKSLTKVLNKKYEKNSQVFPLFLFSKGDVRQAILWAEKLEALHAAKTPGHSCPYTAVYKLVKKLLIYAAHPSIKGMDHGS